MLGRLQCLGQEHLQPGFVMETLQTKRVNGDAGLYREGLPGIHFGLLCDATGHGLLAGVTTLPVADAFLGMAGRDVPLQTIYREINEKLRRLLPADRFVCLLLWRLNSHQGVLSVLNAGMPDAYLLRRGPLRTFPSLELPAGIRDLQAGEDAPVTETLVEPGDRFMAFSDGLLEALTPGAVRDRLVLAGQGLPLEAHLQLIREELHTHFDDLEQADDVSWSLWEAPPPPRLPEVMVPDQGAPHLCPGLRLRIALDPKRHRARDLQPSILTLLGSEGVGRNTLQTLALLLSEAMSNAVDHGILGLDSRLKDEVGFQAFEDARLAALECLMEGEVLVDLTLLHHGSTEAPAWIEVQVRDSGRGFDWRAQFAASDQDTYRTHGRGLAILRSMATDLAFNEAGNGLRFRLPCRG